jgi:putative OmpL-like beta-barrel porin-2
MALFLTNAAPGWAQTLPSVQPAAQSRAAASQGPLSSLGAPIILIQDQPEGQPRAEPPEDVLKGLQFEDTPKWGPVLPEDTKILSSYFPRLEENRLRTFGWMNMGYTMSTSGSGNLPVEPRENRFGNEFVINQMAVVLERTLKSGQFSWGFRSEFYAGADAALIQPKGGIDSPPGNSHFGYDFRQLYLSAHLPVLSEGGIDVRVGRQWSVIGYESAMAPYRPFYSNAYQWFYAEDGAYTGAVATWHANKQLDIVNGITMGGNTFFTFRQDRSPCYIGQINYWLTEEKKTLLSAAIYAGPGSTIGATPAMQGSFETNVEFRIHHQWNKYLTQIIQSNDGWASNVPGIGTGAWYSLYTIGVLQLNPCWNLNGRVEWFDDVQGTRTGISANYFDATIGVDYHPKNWLRLRPEIRGDFADAPAFNNNHRSQMTIGLEALLSF